MRKSLVSLLIGLVFVLAACFEGEPEFSEAEQVPADEREAMEAGEGDGDGAPADEASESVTFVSVDNDFTDAPSEMSAGVVEFELVNEGNIVHNVVVDDLGAQPVVEADGGETATGTVELEPGEYRFHCDIPGHEQSMNGTFTVTD